MSLEKKTDFHLGRFAVGFLVGGISGMISGGRYEHHLAISVLHGALSFPLIDKYFMGYDWSDSYERAPAQITGLYTGLSLAKLICNNL